MTDKDCKVFMSDGNGKAVPIGSVSENGVPLTMNMAKLEIRKHPRERMHKEVRLSYSEYHNSDSRTLEVETHLTFKELRKLCAMLVLEIG